MRHPPSLRVDLCGSGPQERAFLRHRVLEKGLPCGIDFVKICSPGLRLQRVNSAKAHPAMKRRQSGRLERGGKAQNRGEKLPLLCRMITPIDPKMSRVC